MVLLSGEEQGKAVGSPAPAQCTPERFPSGQAGKRLEDHACVCWYNLEA
jgi:hypothetical protein